ncbi:helix-turn-helix domain-containing protein [Actinacidiphila sp. ITFR-21]|uniref:helix-turn-helix domain-containing protein n=1 Tax=Actinacidiphila sp. ITFR-21 TaxID=3075199 RepID=UPI00288B7F28|nr:helix-turn-helix domain-containing protein [Streptomyces sp. ITFR-21]WNI19234.1 helix-turn-helix domain-containing protein [Streptomyces sp. ITFR-21]
MNTTAAALQAGVTTATIRTWCRRGVIAATKTAGRWVIDAASLAHRITIGALKTRKATVSELPFVLTNEIRTPGPLLGVIGPADALRAAFESDTPITLGGKYTGQRVHLGHTPRDWAGRHLGGPRGLDYEMGTYPTHPDVQGACYLVDDTRLEGAPLLRRIIDDALARSAAADARADAADDAYLNDYYE